MASPVGTRRDLLAYGIDLVTMLRGRPALGAAWGTMGRMATNPDELHRRSLHYTITLFPPIDQEGLVGLQVNLDGWHPQHGKTSDLQYKVWVLADEAAQRLYELAHEVLRRSRELI